MAATTKRRSYKPGNFALKVRRASAGLGLFALEAIPKGACIIEYTGRLLAPGEENSSRSRYLFEVSARRTIDGTSRSNTARYINHSCRPNCEPEITKGRVFIFARRAIKPGEELGYDYGKDYFDDMIGDKCRCVKCAEKRAAKRVAKKAKGETRSR